MIYLLRHGQTEFNMERRIQGRCDSPLTSQGRDQSGQGQPISPSRASHITKARCQPTRRQGSASPERKGLSSASPKAKLSGGVQLSRFRVTCPVLRGRP